MKKIGLLILVLVSLQCLGQTTYSTTTYFGTVSTLNAFRGPVQLSGPVYLGRIDTTFTPSFLGGLVYRLADNGVYVSIALTGHKWQKLSTGGGGGSASFGSISGDIEDQTNLQFSLDQKLNRADTSTLSNRINLKLSISDTANMLTNYRHWLAGYLKYSDTLTRIASHHYVDSVVNGLPVTSLQAATDAGDSTDHEIKIKRANGSTYLVFYDTDNEAISGVIDNSSTPFQAYFTGSSNFSAFGYSSIFRSLGGATQNLTYPSSVSGVIPLSVNGGFANDSGAINLDSTTNTGLATVGRVRRDSAVLAAAIAAGGTTYTAGNGLTLSSTTFKADTAIVATKNYVQKIKDTVQANVNVNTAAIAANTTAINLRKLNNDSTATTGYTSIGKHRNDSTVLQAAINAKQGALSLTTTGTSGAASLIGNTLNIPNYAGSTDSAVYATKATAQYKIDSLAALTPGQKAARRFEFFEDFLYPQKSPFDSRVSGGSFSTANFSLWNYPGSAYVQTGTGTTGYAQMDMLTSSTYGPRVGQGEIIFEAGNIGFSALADATNNFIAYIGPSVDARTTLPFNAFYFEYNKDSSANWRVGSANGSTRASVTTTIPVVANTAYDLKLVMNAAGTQVRAYINGTEVSASSGTYPITTPIMVNTTPTSPGAIIRKLAGTTAVFMYMDFISLVQNLTTAR